jgi:hypothetical protein
MAVSPPSGNSEPAASSNQWWLRVRGRDHLELAGGPACGAPVTTGAIRVNRAIAACRACEDILAMENRARLIEQLLDWLEHATVTRAAGDWPDPPNPRFFDQAWPLTPLDFTEGRGFIPAPDLVDIADLKLPFDVRFLTVEPDVVLQRVRAIPAAQVRGRVRQFLPYPLEWTLVFPDTGRWQRVYVGRAGAHRWLQLAPNARMIGGRDGRYKTVIDDSMFMTADDLSSRTQLAVALQIAQRHVWRVYLAYEGKPGLEFPTDPHGAREVFRLRDIPDGRARRAALRHWVQEHWRANRTEPSEEILVRQHLSGATDFNWHGLECRISPSDTDLEKLQGLLEAREEARIAGTDRRPRTWA